MFKIPKPEFTPESMELAVKRVKSGMTIGAVARELQASSIGAGRCFRRAFETIG